METGTSCQPTSIAPFRAAPFKFSRCPNFAVATSSDKRAWVQTGKSVQLQDASVGGPEEGCRALFIHKRCRGSREMGIDFCNAGRSFNTTSHIKMEKRAAREAARTTKKSQNLMRLAYLATLLILYKDPGHFWSPRRPLVQSANVKSESLLAAQSHINYINTT